MAKHQTRRTIRGEDHHLVILKIQTRDSNGRPSECRLIYDDQTVSTLGNPEFMTAYVPAKMVQKTGN